MVLTEYDILFSYINGQTIYVCSTVLKSVSTEYIRLTNINYNNNG